LTTQHANAHIPIVLGAARRHEVVEDSDEFKKVVENFWNILYTTRTYATGGSNGGNGSDYATLEHWGEPNRLLLTLTNNNQEFCTQYAILKVIKYLIEWTGDIKYADHFEQAYFNGIMGNQYPGQPGVMLYYTPLGMGYFKGDPTWISGWGTPFNSFWCCYASGVEQWTKMAESIFFYSSDESELLVNLYISSMLNWETRSGGKIVLQQSTLFPESGQSQFRFIDMANETAELTLSFRIPYWVPEKEMENITVTINGENLPLGPVQPKQWLRVRNQWRVDDVITLNLPMNFHVLSIVDDPSTVAVLYGPLVMVGLTDTARTLTLPSDLSSCFVSKGTGLIFTMLPECLGGGAPMNFMPLYKTVNERYGVYWKTI